jgi:hypothetical protein
MLPGPIAVLLAVFGPAGALILSLRAFRRRSWRTYRNLAMASSLSSLFCLVVVAYVIFLGRGGGFHGGLMRLRLGLAYGGIQIFTFAVVSISAALGTVLIGRRTDEERADAPVGRPMLAVFSVLLMTLLTVSLIVIETEGTIRQTASALHPAP